MSHGHFTITDRALSAYSATIRQMTAPIEYEIDAKGRKVRKPNLDRPVTWEEQQAFLLGNRVVDEEDVLEALGSNAFKSMVKTGKLRKDERSSCFYWITAHGAEFFKLPRVMGCRFPA